jgi:hypothetical protein
MNVGRRRIRPEERRARKRSSIQSRGEAKWYEPSDASGNPTGILRKGDVTKDTKNKDSAQTNGIATGGGGDYITK